MVPARGELSQICTTLQRISNHAVPASAFHLTQQGLSITSRLERYPGSQDSWIRATAKKAYYQLRPFMRRSVRERIQRFQLSGWKECAFPGWPVDFSVDNIHERLLVLALRSSSARRIPFIWFWPHGTEACVIMTHDVEGTAGRDHCEALMDIDDTYRIKASFQLVPEGSVPAYSRISCLDSQARF